MFHERVLKSWYIILGVFAVFTFFFELSNKEFRERLNPTGEFDFESIGAKDSFYAQIFSPSNRLEGGAWTKLDPDYWKKWNDILNDRENGGSRAIYTRIFWIDNVWALIVALLIYRFAFCFGASRKAKPVLALILSLAYLFDLAENFSYLGQTGESLALWIPSICRVKMILFFAGGLLSIVHLIGNLRWRSRF